MASSRNKHSTDAVADVQAACATAVARTGLTAPELAVGLSGGMDSAVLLHAMRSVCKARGLALEALHVNHGLSPHANRWEAFCVSLCQDWQIPLAVERVIVERNSSDGLEGAARRARYGALFRSSHKTIVLAHHRGDQAETVLFNLLRGAGLSGASGMPYYQRRLLRPLLNLPRHALATYAAENQLTWIEDESNADIGFSRNYLRHDVLQPLAQRFPGAERNLAAAGSRFGEALRLLDDLACADLAGNSPDFPIPVKAIETLDEPRARNVLRYLMRRRGIGIASEQRLRETLRQLLSAAEDRHPKIRFGSWTVFRQRGQICAEISSPPSAGGRDELGQFDC